MGSCACVSGTGKALACGRAGAGEHGLQARRQHKRSKVVTRTSESVHSKLVMMQLLQRDPAFPAGCPSHLTRTKWRKWWQVYGSSRAVTSPAEQLQSYRAQAQLPAPRPSRRMLLSWVECASPRSARPLTSSPMSLMVLTLVPKVALPPKASSGTQTSQLPVLPPLIISGTSAASFAVFRRQMQYPKPASMLPTRSECMHLTTSTTHTSRSRTECTMPSAYVQLNPQQMNHSVSNAFSTKQSVSVPSLYGGVSLKARKVCNTGEN